MVTRPSDLKYARSHEWARLEGDIVTLGITDFAIQELTDLTYIGLPDVGDTIKKGDAFGDIESVKAVSDLFAPCGGEVLEVNPELTENENFEILARDPFGAGWLLKLRISDPAELNEMLDSAAYQKVVEESEDH
ncbi:MAG: glycine cleavage system protein GcvH [Planctomycetota bacterium]